MVARSDSEIVVTIGHGEVDMQVGMRKAATVPLALDETRRETIELLRDYLAKKEGVTPRLLRVLGRHLFEAIFHGATLEELARGFREAGAHRLRILLSFDDSAKELAEYPWEFMLWVRRTAPTFFLSTHMSISLCRYMELEEDREELELPEGELRILLVVSRPDPQLSGLHAVDETVIREALESARVALADRDPPIAIAIDVLRAPTRSTLSAAVRAKRPHVLHFMGHGRFQSGRGEIALVKPDGVRVDWCTDEVFAQYVAPKGAGGPLLVVLHMCEGAVVDFEQSFRGMAPQLVLNRVPAVVAMQYSITDRDAQVFSAEFYRRLGEGFSIDAAAQMARFQLYSQEDSRSPRGFGTPVLYLHSIDGVLKPTAAAAAAGAAQRSPLGSHVPPSAPEEPRPPSAPEEPRPPAGAPATRVDLTPAPPHFEHVATGPGLSQVSLRLTNQVVSKLWEAVSAECEARKYDLSEVSAEVKKMIKTGSDLKLVSEIRSAIGERISNGPTERFYSVYVRMDEALPPERVPQ